jgi:hypothetical protein
MTLVACTEGAVWDETMMMQSEFESELAKEAKEVVGGLAGGWVCVGVGEG